MRDCKEEKETEGMRGWGGGGIGGFHSKRERAEGERDGQAVRMTGGEGTKKKRSNATKRF